MALSPDGKQVAVSGKDAPIYIWDVASGKQIHLLKNVKTAWQLVYCQEGKVLAIIDEEAKVTLLEVSSGKQLFAVKDKDFGASALACSPDGKELAIAFKEYVVVWDLKIRKEKWRSKALGEFVGVALPFGWLRLAAVNSGFRSCSVLEFDATSGKQVNNFESKGEVAGHCVAYVGKNQLACGRQDGSILVWEVGSGKLPVELQGELWASIVPSRFAGWPIVCFRKC